LEGSGRFSSANSISEAPARMKLLFSSSDLGELGRLVKRLVWARIPCAVCKDPINSHLSVWIQRDIDFPLALHVFTNRDAPRRLPHWARALDSALPATNGIELPGEPLIQSKEPTWTGKVGATALRYAPQQTRPARPQSLQVTQASAKGLVKPSLRAYKGSGRSEAHYEKAALGR
jgi:hypothetical protein